MSSQLVPHSNEISQQNEVCSAFADRLRILNEYCTEETIFVNVTPDENMKTYLQNTIRILKDEIRSQNSCGDNFYTIAGNILIVINNVCVAADKEKKPECSLKSIDFNAKTAIAFMDRTYHFTDSHEVMQRRQSGCFYKLIRNEKVHKYLRGLLCIPVGTTLISGICSLVYAMRYAPEEEKTGNLFSSIGHWIKYDVLRKADPVSVQNELRSKSTFFLKAMVVSLVIFVVLLLVMLIGQFVISLLDGIVRRENKRYNDFLLLQDVFNKAESMNIEYLEDE